MPPTETETVEDMSWRVVLQSAPSAANGISCLGILILTNYRLMFVPESTLLASFDPKTPPPGFGAEFQVPIMLIADVRIPTADCLFIRTKDAKEYYFR
jgi:hypothetical protein